MRVSGNGSPGHSAGRGSSPRYRRSFGSGPVTVTMSRPAPRVSIAPRARPHRCSHGDAGAPSLRPLFHPEVAPRSRHRDPAELAYGCAAARVTGRFASSSRKRPIESGSRWARRAKSCGGSPWRRLHGGGDADHRASVNRSPASSSTTLLSTMRRIRSEAVSRKAAPALDSSRERSVPRSSAGGPIRNRAEIIGGTFSTSSRRAPTSSAASASSAGDALPGRDRVCLRVRASGGSRVPNVGGLQTV